MTILPKLPVCPHCGTVYGYGDVNKIKNKKSDVCYHCGKGFGIAKTKRIILAAEFIAVCVVLNIFALLCIKGINIVALYIVNLLPTVALPALLPYYTEFVKPKPNDGGQ